MVYMFVPTNLNESRQIFTNTLKGYIDNCTKTIKMKDKSKKGKDG